MQGVIAHCPMCHGRLLTADAPIGDLKPQRIAGETYYCPTCEMFVEPEEGAVGIEETLATIDPDITPEDRGRPRASGTNAGGSQRGDDSDEGASQWRRDPQETERNTWKDKD
ncbi:MAG TPA: hypothetical protein VIY69_15350 [Candidatus Acidoferrales bacterium]